MRRRDLLMVVLGVAVVVGAYTTQRVVLGSDGLVNCDVSDHGNDAEELAFLEIINGYRTDNGLNRLNISDTLNRAATWMVTDMATKGYFSHTDSSGRSPYQRALDCGYPQGAGENLAGGTAWDTAQEVFNAWRNSPGHNANMLGSLYREIGIARVFVNGSTYGWYWATEFGAVNSSPPPQPVTPTNTPRPFPTMTPSPTVTSAPDRVEHTIYYTFGGFDPPVCYLDRMDTFRFHNLTPNQVTILPGPGTSPFLTTSLGPNQISKGFSFPFIGSQHFYSEQNPNLTGRITTDRGRHCERTGATVVPTSTPSATPTEQLPTITPTPTQVTFPPFVVPFRYRWDHPTVAVADAHPQIRQVAAIYHQEPDGSWTRWIYQGRSYLQTLTHLVEGEYYWVIPR